MVKKDKTNVRVYIHLDSQQRYKRLALQTKLSRKVNSVFASWLEEQEKKQDRTGEKKMDEEEQGVSPHPNTHRYIKQETNSKHLPYSMSPAVSNDASEKVTLKDASLNSNKEENTMLSKDALVPNKNCPHCQNKLFVKDKQLVCLCGYVDPMRLNI